MTIKPIPIAFITDENYLMPTSVSITSLLATKLRDTVYEIFVIAVDCSETSKERLRSFQGLQIIDASVYEYRNIHQLGYISRACLLKFNLCELISQHKKVLYLDSDIIVREDLTDLYNTELGESYAAAVYARLEPGDPRRKINGGVLLFNAEKMRRDNMREKLAQFRLELGDSPSMDQKTFNLVLGENFVPLSVRYNCMPPVLSDTLERHGLEYLNRFFQTSYASLEACLADAAIIHYPAGLKPWKYTHAPYEEEWMAHYHNSPFGHEPLKRCGQWGQRWQILANIYATRGLRAVVIRLLAFIWHKTIGRKPETVWG